MLLIASSFALQVDAGFSSKSMAFSSLAVRNVNWSCLTGTTSILFHIHLDKKLRIAVLFAVLVPPWKSILFFCPIFFMDVVLTGGLLLEKSLQEGCITPCPDPHGLRAAVCWVCCCCPRSRPGSQKCSPKEETHVCAPGSSVYYTSKWSLQEVKPSSVTQERSCFLKAIS